MPALVYGEVLLALLTLFRLCCCSGAMEASTPTHAVAGIPPATVASTSDGGTVPTASGAAVVLAAAGTTATPRDHAASPTAHCTGAASVDLAVPTGAALDHAHLLVTVWPPPRLAGHSGHPTARWLQRWRGPPTPGCAVLRMTSVLRV